MPSVRSGFLGYARRRVKMNKNFICGLTGATGSGKSWGALKIGEELDDNFSIDNLWFTSLDMMKLINGKVRKLKKGSVIIWDEMQIEMSNMDFQTRVSKVMNQLLQTFRNKNFIFLATMPYFDLLNKSSRKMYHCRMETLGINNKEETIRLKPLLLQYNQKRAKVYEKYLRYVDDGKIKICKRLLIGKPSDELTKAYEEKKQAYTDSLNLNIEKELEIVQTKAEWKLREQVPKFSPMQLRVRELMRQGMTQKDIAKELNVSQPAISYQLQNLKGRK